MLYAEYSVKLSYGVLEHIGCKELLNDEKITLLVPMYADLDVDSIKLTSVKSENIKEFIKTIRNTSFFVYDKLNNRLSIIRDWPGFD